MAGFCWRFAQQKWLATSSSAMGFLFVNHAGVISLSDWQLSWHEELTGPGSLVKQ
jgi:hypothetical protein